MSRSFDEFDELDTLILQTRAGVIAKLDAATDFDAVLTDIYAKAGKAAPTRIRGTFTNPADRPGLSEADGDVDGVCGHIDMLNAVLEAAAAHEVSSPVVATMHLATARRSLLRLRGGLSGRRLDRNDALRLIGNVEHNLREADTVLRTEYGLSLDEALHDRVGELRELGGDLTGQIQALRRRIVVLFDDATDPTSLTPIPRS